MKTSPAYMEGKYFILPNEVFSLGLSPAAIAVYAYLMRLENRKTNVCWAKQKTIGNAVGIKSEKTVAKALAELEDAELIYREATTMNHKGRKVNGVQLFTIRPIEDAVQHHQWMQMEAISLAAAQQSLEDRVAKYNVKHPEMPVRVAPMDSAYGANSSDLRRTKEKAG